MKKSKKYSIQNNKKNSKKNSRKKSRRRTSRRRTSRRRTSRRRTSRRRTSRRRISKRTNKRYNKKNKKYGGVAFKDLDDIVEYYEIGAGTEGVVYEINEKNSNKNEVIKEMKNTISGKNIKELINIYKRLYYLNIGPKLIKTKIINTKNKSIIKEIDENNDDDNIDDDVNENEQKYFVRMHIEKFDNDCMKTLKMLPDFELVKKLINMVLGLIKTMITNKIICSDFKFENIFVKYKKNNDGIVNVLEKVVLGDISIGNVYAIICIVTDDKNEELRCEKSDNVKIKENTSEMLLKSFEYLLNLYVLMMICIFYKFDMREIYNNYTELYKNTIDNKRDSEYLNYMFEEYVANVVFYGALVNMLYRPYKSIEEKINKEIVEKDRKNVRRELFKIPDLKWAIYYIKRMYLNLNYPRTKAELLPSARPNMSI
jgi:hypothetical protein